VPQNKARFGAPLFFGQTIAATDAHGPVLVADSSPHPAVVATHALPGMNRSILSGLRKRLP